jgi:hypothetical protein
LLVPAGTPAPIVGRLNAETVKVLGRADVKATLVAQGLEVAPGSSEQFAAHIKSEIARFGRDRQSGRDQGRVAALPRGIPFALADLKLDGEFLKGAEARGMVRLKGHRAVGGMRASIYNAMAASSLRESLVAVGKTLHNGGTTEHDVYLAWLEIPELRRYQYGRFMELLLTFLLEIDPMAVFLTFP